MGPVPTPVPTPAPTPVATTMLWPQYGADNSKCTTSAAHSVVDRLSCQVEAVAAGHVYYQYHANMKKCATSATCTQPITDTNGPWKIFRAIFWPQYGADNSK